MLTCNRIRIIACVLLASCTHEYTYALKMLPPETVCQQEGLQEGTPAFQACVAREQARQAALIKSIMGNEQAPEQPTTQDIPESVPTVEPAEVLAPLVPDNQPTPPNDQAVQATTRDIPAPTHTTTPIAVAVRQASPAVLSHASFSELDHTLPTSTIDQEGNIIQPPAELQACAPTPEKVDCL